MSSPTGVIPELLMHASKKRDVIEFLKAAPAEAKQKKALLLGWAQTVGVRCQARDYRNVEATGIDR